jgi:xylan 1,4-beta-xylosidase
MFSKMSGRRLTAESDNAVPLATMLSEGVRNSPDVAAMASLDANTLSVMVWHYHDDDVAGPAANVELLLNGLPSNFAKGNLRHFRIDESHSNAYSAWKRMGEPQNPTPDQYAELEKAGQLALLTTPEEIHCNQGSVSLRFELPRQAVSLLVIDRS